jgi:N-acetylglucosamine kinase-like BadF-type ATPase
VSGPLVLAVDGGNTKTLALVADAGAQVHGLGRAGCADIYGAVSPAAALAEVEAAVAAALAGAGAEPTDVAASVFSLAGADWPEDHLLLEDELRRRTGVAGELVIVNDALGALRGGSPDWSGIAIVFGTGGAVGARHPDGRTFHLGFWPDGIGARQLGREGLRAVYRADLDMGPATQLTELALARYDAPGVVAMLHDFTRRGGRPASDDGQFAADVLDAADAGDAVALDLVAAQAHIASGQGQASAARVGLGLDGTTVVITGGLLAHPSRLLVDMTMARLPGAVLALPVQPPIVGAALLAFDRLGVAADAATLRAGLPASLSERSAAWAASHSST